MRTLLAATLITAGVLIAPGCASAPPSAAVPPDQLDSLRGLVVSVTGSSADYDDIVEMVGDDHFVLLGDSTHGTREFYRERARLTRRLIEEKGFTIVALEANWPDAYQLNEFIHGRGASTAAAAVKTFSRFPQWMWGNSEVQELIEWLRTYNAAPEAARQPVGIYGIDLYSVVRSMDDVVEYLGSVDPPAAKVAADRYGCLRRYREDDLVQYGAEVAARTRASCKAAVTAQFTEMTQRVAAAADRHRPGDDRPFSAWQNARVVTNGEAYYRTIQDGSVASWNLRDHHMADTIDALSRHLDEEAGGRPAKVVVWAHNSHLGDARVTARAGAGELNVGQLMRQRHGGRTLLLGFLTHSGTVRAADRWGAPGREHSLRPAMPGSFAAIFHELGIPAFTLRLRGSEAAARALAGTRPERFVGVIYMPGSERQSHYFDVDLARQFDAVVYIDRTTALR